jgi:putative transposase
MDADKWAQTRQNGSYRDIFTPRMKSDETLPATMPHDGRLKRENTGRSRYFYIFPIPLGENQAPEQELEKGGGGVVSVDPGVRCFATLYDPQNRTVTNWGDGDVDKLYQLHYKLDRLQAMLNSNVPKTRPMNKQKQRPTIWPQWKVRKRQRYQWRRESAMLWRRIRALVDEAHKKLATYLCSSYDTIILPEFATQRMISRGHRNIGPKTARAMCSWAHYRFRQRLLDKAREYPGCHVLLCDESYTSKTCGACGSVHSRLGGSKRFVCPSCTASLDRDANGARNILLRYLNECGVESPATGSFIPGDPAW